MSNVLLPLLSILSVCVFGIYANPLTILLVCLLAIPTYCLYLFALSCFASLLASYIFTYNYVLALIDFGVLHKQCWQLQEQFRIYQPFMFTMEEKLRYAGCQGHWKGSESSGRLVSTVSLLHSDVVTHAVW